MIKGNNKERYFYICILAGCFFMFLVWAMVIPFNHGPDEHMRYEIPKFIYKYGYLPHGGDERIRDPSWGISYGFSPILSYIFSAFFMKITGIFTTSENALLLSARLVSVLSSTGTVYFCIKISEKLFKGAFKYAFVISVAFLPQFVFISSYVNNDSFGIFTIAWIVYAMILAKEKKWSFKYCAFLGIGIGLCSLSYYNCYGIIVVAAFYAIVSVITDKNIENKVKFVFTRIGWVLLFAFIVAGWWFIRNAIIYNGDFLGLKTSGEYSEKYALDWLKPENRITTKNLGISFKEMLIDRRWMIMSIESFIGNFDSMCVPLEKWNYNIMYVFATIGFLGSFIPRKITKKDNDCSIILRLSCCLMCIITISISIAYSWFCDFEAQGRYCLPMLVMLNILLIYGWSSIFNRFYAKIKNLICCLIIGVYCIELLYASCFVLIPHYCL